MQHHAAQPGVGLGAQRVQRAQPKHMPGVDRIGIAHQPGHFGQRQLPGPLVHRRAGRGARRGIDLGHAVERGGKVQPAHPLSAHVFQRLGPADRGQAVHQVHQPVQPARRHGLRLGPPDRAGQHHARRGDRLLIVMRRQADLAIRQEQARLFPHRPVQPGVRRRLGGPGSVVQPTQDHQIRPLPPRLQRAPDHDAGMHGFGLAHLMPLQHAMEQRRIIAGRDIAARPSLGLQLGHGLQRLFARLFQPERTRACIGKAPRQAFGDVQMPGDHGGQGHPADDLLPAQQVAHDPRPVRRAVQRHARGPGRQTGRIREGRAMAAQVQLIFARQDQVLAPAGTGKRQRMLQDRQQRIPGQPLPEQRRDLPHQPTGGRQRQRTARRIVRPDAPAIQCRRHPPRQVAVGRDQRRPDPVFRRLPQDQRQRKRLGPFAGGFDQGHPFGRGPQVGQLWPLGQPLVGDRRRPQRQRDQPVSIRRRGGGDRPAPHRRRPAAQQVHHPAKAELGMILGGQGVFHPLPNLGRQVEIITRQHHPPGRQPRHRLHQQRRRPA